MKISWRHAALVLVVPFVLIAAHPAAGPQEGLPEARDVVARHIEAIGGAEAYRAVQSIHARGRLEIPAQGIVAAFELLTARPARMLYRVTLPGIGRIENAYDGRVGWSLNPISGPEVLSGRQLVEAAEDAWFDAPLHEPARISELRTVDRTTFDGQSAYKIRVVFHTGHEQFEYFDVDTGLQIGSEASRATPQGIVPTTNIMRDYKQFGPLRHATTFVQRALGFEQVVTLTSCEYDSVPASAFEPPPAVAALLAP